MTTDSVPQSSPSSKRPIFPLVLLLIALAFNLLVLSVVSSSLADVKALQVGNGAAGQLNITPATNFYTLELVALSIFTVLFLVNIALYFMRKKTFTLLLLASYALAVGFFIIDPFMEKPVLEGIYNFAQQNGSTGQAAPVFNTGKLVFAAIYAGCGLLSALQLLMGKKAKAAFVK